MKKFTLIIFVICICFITASSQSCIPDSIAFTTQTEIDNFQTNNPGCTEIEGDVWIEGKDITNLNGLDVLTSIGGYLWVNNNPSLTSLTGLDNLTSIGEELNIKSNPLLSNLIGLNNLTTIGGYLGFSGNIALISLTGLNNLSTIGGFFGFVVNNAITSLTGLENVISIGGNIVIRGNESLTSLTGLDNVISIGGSIVIRQHPALTSLTGLDNIDPGSISNLWLLDNTSLSDCAIQSVCDYLISPGGSVDINNNAPNCNSQAEVEEACEVVTIHEQPANTQFSLYPNPARNKINISAEGYTIDEVTIYTLTGQQVLQERLVNGIIDIYDLQPGMYIVEVTIENTRLRQKLLVQR